MCALNLRILDAHYFCARFFRTTLTDGVAMIEHAADANRASKRATNISLSVEVYEAARELGINISQTCERSLRDSIREKRQQLWNAQHAEFIAAYNRAIEDEGVALQEWRAF